MPLGFGTIPEDSRGVVESWGAFERTLQPGWYWLIPQKQRLRGIVVISQEAIPLFTDAPAQIDFPDGSATIVGAEAFVRIHEPDDPYDLGDGLEEDGVYRAIYRTRDWRGDVRSQVGSLVRTYLGALDSLDDALGEQGGYDLLREGVDGVPDKQVSALREVLEGIGIELLSVTIQDFELSPELLTAREEINRRRAESEAAEYIAKTRATETMGVFMGMIALSTGQDIEVVEKEIEKDSDRKAQMLAIAADFTTRGMSLNGNSLQDIRVSGGGNLESALASLMAIWKP